MHDKVDKVQRFFELLKIFCVNHEAKFIFDLDNKFNGVKRVEAVVNEEGVESDARFLSCSEVIANHAQNVLLDFFFLFEDERCLLSVGTFFPELNVATFTLDFGR